ncbi:MAG TPA: Uma2 family endonuclease [Gemmataceae bacterium]|nr:Uma2 family endonuclease [Gemmataceae bacterium]
MAAPTIAPTNARKRTKVRSLADAIHRLGDIPLERIRFQPAPGTATKADVIREAKKDGFYCELVDGILVEKAVGIRESLLAMIIGRLLLDFVLPRNLGIVTGEQGLLQLFPGLVRGPDVAYIAWSSIPGGAIPEVPIPHLVPDLAVEVLSKSNTKREIQRKLNDYFDAGVKLAWVVDPRRRTVRVHVAAEDFVELKKTETLGGGSVLPGFSLPLAKLFAELDRKAPKG